MNKLTKFHAKFCIIITFAICLLILTSCSKNDGYGYLFRYGLINDPKNLDPQLASDVSSLVVIGNMFDGLMRIADNGKLTEGVAKNYEMSPDGLTYTFFLRDNSYWNSTSLKDIKRNVTADDFVFALRRVVDTKTKSPYAENFKCIKNAKYIINDMMEPNKLGVTATSKFTLTIELEYPNANFLSLLTTNAAMPCNEEFFYNTKGKYGLETDASLSNGAFFLHQWEYDPYGKSNYLIMRKNPNHYMPNSIYPSGLNFFIKKSYEDVITDFYNGSIDCVVLAKEDKKILNNNNNTVLEYAATSSGLIYNTKDKIFFNAQIREALSLSINRAAFSTDLSPSQLTAYGIVPPGISMLNKSYREMVSDLDKSIYNENLAKTKWQEALIACDRITIEGVKILVPESMVNPDSLKFVTQQWQNALNFFCGIEIVSDVEYNNRLLDGKYQIALYEINTTYNNPESMLRQFSPFSIDGNTNDYFNPEVEKLLELSLKTENLSDCVKLYSQAERLILTDYFYTPLFYCKQYLAFSKNISDIQYNPFTKQVDFRNSKRYK